MRSIPWLTPKSIEFLKSFLAERPGGKVLEFGCGGSTVWLAGHDIGLVSIEHDKAWFDEVSKELMLNEHGRTWFDEIPEKAELRKRSKTWFDELSKEMGLNERDRIWFNEISKGLDSRRKRVDLRLLSRPYDAVCGGFPDAHFDLVLVDGRDRVKCV